MRKDTNYTISHDPKDAACFTHRVKLVKSKYAGDVVGIVDENPKNYHFLKAWNNMEIDINNQWSINNGVMGLELELHKDGKHKVRYMIKLSLKLVKKILETKLNCMVICDEGQNPLLHFRPLKVEQLYEFYLLKIQTDRYLKDNNQNPSGWIID